MTELATLKDLKSQLVKHQTVTPQVGTIGGDYIRMGRDGVWMYGMENIEPDPDGVWAVHPTSFTTGFIAWKDKRHGGSPEKLGEVMAPLGQSIPRSDLAEIRVAESGKYAGEPLGEWRDQSGMSLACVSGDDKGEQVIFNSNSMGGRRVIENIINAVIAQLDDDPEKPVPLVTIGSDSYIHKQHGKTYVPIIEIVGWNGLDDTSVPEDDEPEQIEDKSDEEESPRPRRRRQRS